MERPYAPLLVTLAAVAGFLGIALWASPHLPGHPLASPMVAFGGAAVVSIGATVGMTRATASARGRCSRPEADR